MSDSPYATALEKLKVLAAFVDTHPDTTGEKLFTEIAADEVVDALKWFSAADPTPPEPTLEMVVHLVKYRLLETYFNAAEGRLYVSISQLGRAKLLDGLAGATWNRRLLTAREAAEVLSMLEHYRKRGERESTEEDD